MNLKFYIKISFLSIFILFALTPLGGYGGHHLKFLAAALIYYTLIVTFLSRTTTKKEMIIVVLIFSIPPFALYAPIHIIDFNNTNISFPSSLAHMVGIIFGVLTHLARFKTKILLGFLLIVGSLWFTFIGYTFWLHKLNFGTYTGNVNYPMPATLTGQTQTGQMFTNEIFKNKIILLDFWHTSCGICFKKFPQLQKLYDNYKSDTSIVILAVNKPLKQDKAGQAFAVLKERNYSFPIFIPTIDSLPELFDVHVYPTTILIDRTGTVIFRGDIEKVKSKLMSLTKNGM